MDKIRGFLLAIDTLKKIEINITSPDFLDKSSVFFCIVELMDYFTHMVSDYRIEKHQDDEIMLLKYEEDIAPRSMNNGENLDGYYEWLYEYYKSTFDISGDPVIDYHKLIGVNHGFAVREDILSVK